MDAECPTLVVATRSDGSIDIWVEDHDEAHPFWFRQEGAETLGQLQYRIRIVHGTTIQFHPRG